MEVKSSTAVSFSTDTPTSQSKPWEQYSMVHSLSMMASIKSTYTLASLQRDWSSAIPVLYKNTYVLTFVSWQPPYVFSTGPAATELCPLHERKQSWL